MLTKTYILLEVTHKKDDPDMLDKITGRAYTIDGVEEVLAKIVPEGLLFIDHEEMTT